MKPAIWPTCAKCGTPVDRVYRWRDESKHETVFVCQCHGDVETTHLPDGMVLTATKIELGFAFGKSTGRQLYPRSCEAKS